MSHKFMLLVADTHYVIEDVDSDIANKMYMTDEPRLIVVEGYHGAFDDNIIGTEQGYDLFKGTNGLLYHFYDWMSKNDIVNAFE